MEPEKNTMQNMFPQAKKVSFKEKEQPFFTNFYQVKFKENYKEIYQFSFKVEPQIPVDSSTLIRKTVQAATQLLKQRIQLFTYSGFMIWGFKPLGSQQICEKVSFKYKEVVYQYTVTVQQAKILNFFEMKQYPKQANRYLQILNIKVQNEVRKLDYVDLGKGVYAHKKSLKNHVIEEYRVNVCQGFKFTLTPISNQIYIKIDLHTRLFQTSSVLELINEEIRIKKKTKQEVLKYFEGSTILSNYGSFNSYKIKSIDFKKNPKEKFQNGGKYISYVDYYLEKYAIKIKNLEQPLLVVESNSSRSSKVSNDLIYLVPQLVILAGLPDERIKQQFRFTQQLAKLTKVNPQQRMNIIEDFLDDLSENQDILKIEDYLQTKGHVFQQPEIKVGKSVLKSQQGRISLRDAKLKDAATFDDWVLIYSLSHKPQDDVAASNQIVQTFQKAAKCFGIKVQQPGFLEINGKNVELWKKKMQQDIQKNGKPQIIVIVANIYEEKFYGQFKKWLLLEKNIPSQIVCKKKILKKGLTIPSNILLQMNVKIGKSIWQIQRNHPYIIKTTIASAGISISQNLIRNSFTLSLVGSLNNSSNQFCSLFDSTIKSKSQIPGQNMKLLFKQWIASYYAKAKVIPSFIIIYRQGLTDSQASTQIPQQISSLKQAVIDFSKEQQKQLKTPKIIYLIVTKTIDTRFFTISKQVLKNPKSGSIIPQQPDGRNKYTFYLVPHLVHEGTCTPTHFRVVYDDSTMRGDALMRFTFEQCFNYFNWQGAVRVPAVLQYAEKLSAFVAKHFAQNLKSNDLCNTLYYI